MSGKNKSTGRPKKEPVHIRDCNLDPDPTAHMREQWRWIRGIVKIATGLDEPEEIPPFLSPHDIHAGELESVKATLARLILDPKGNHPNAELLAPVLLGFASPYWKPLVGNILVKSLEVLPPKELGKLLNDALALKQSASTKTGHRNFFAYRAYLSFLIEMKREPSKPELKAYILGRYRTDYPDAPAEGDGKGWTRLWKEAGLSKLDNR